MAAADTYEIDNSEIYQFLIQEKNKMMQRQGYQARSWYDTEHAMTISICDGLYHANSVSTALSYIWHGMMYSRQYGEQNFTTEQTVQISDETDKQDGVYNDIFMDNCDIRGITGKHSAYGPVSFVLDEKLLLNPGLHVRIMKMNPGNMENGRKFGELSIEEKYFTTREELEKCAEESTYPFRTVAKFHTTLRNRKSIPLTSQILKYILVEKNQHMEQSEAVKEKLEQALVQAGLGEVPVILRQTDPNWHIRMSTSPWELWKIPE